jgi:predicted RNase H-like nuclease (RuvC/YqgF family)
MNVPEIKAYQEKVNAQLQESKALLNGFEAHAKGKLAQSEIDTIKQLKAKHQEIDQKVHHDLKAATEVTVAAKIKSDIDAEVAKFKTSVNQLAAKLKSQPAA